MTRFKAACIQMTSGTNPQANLETATSLIAKAKDAGAEFIATPEMTGCMNIRGGDSRGPVFSEADDPLLKALQATASENQIWLLIGSLAIASDIDTRMANRSFLISPSGEVVARYDKIHMFDVNVGDGQSYRESSTYRPGNTAIIADTQLGAFGLSICYDLRFPHLYRALAQNGTSILTCPAAFTRVTGEAHWHTLLRARAIETGCYVIAPAQSGLHEDGRETFGHSLIINPWGEIIAESHKSGEDIIFADIDTAEVTEARSRIPSLNKSQNFSISKK